MATFACLIRRILPHLQRLIIIFSGTFSKKTKKQRKKLAAAIANNSKVNMIGIDIRFATTEDCKALFTVIASVIQNISYYNDVAKKDETSKFQPHNLQTKIEEDKFSVILATHSSKIVGFCLSRFDDYLIWLEWFGVLDDYRGKGISNRLLTALDQTVIARKCHKIWCDCRTSNSASIHILASHGYNHLVTVANHWYNQDFILWEKSF